MSPMDEFLGLLAAHGGKMALVLGLVLLAPAGASLLGGQDLHVAANAPKKGDTMSVLVTGDTNLLGSCNGEATVEVLKGDFKAYTATRNVEMDGCEGVVEVPYSEFASENGIYTVQATYGDQTATTDVEVDKVVNWVYLRAFPNEDEQRTRVDVSLESSQGSPLASSIFGAGTLELDIRWEECTQQTIGFLITDPRDDCQATQSSVFYEEIPVEHEASTHVIIPWENLEADQDGDGNPEEGWYNVTATFHNDLALANSNVPMDPTLFNEDPPATWFEVEY